MSRLAPTPSRQQQRPLICAYCRAELSARVACDECRALYHAECWRLVGECASLGCANRAPAPPRPRPTATRGRLALLWYEFAPVVGFFGVLLSAMGLVFAWSLTITV